VSPRLVVVVPYRDRDDYLREFLANVPRYLELQNGITDYRIVISEQTDAGLFSAALAKNVGALFAINELSAGYLLFNDVDTIPVENVDYRFNGRNCICFMNFGNCRIDVHDFLTVNGYNPRIAGWGYEDTEFYHRLSVFGLDFVRWELQEESWYAVVRDLELRKPSAEEELAHSLWYWRREPSHKGPRFVSAPPGLKHYDRARNWFAVSRKERNLEMVNGIYNLRATERLAYYLKTGNNLVDLCSVHAETADKVVRVRFATTDVSDVPATDEVMVD
jgi:beta-1,4-galactosyltransferase 1